MLLLELLATVAAVTLLAISVAGVIIVGLSRLSSAVADYRRRLRVTLPYLALLGIVLAINSVARRIGTDLSWLIGWNITGTLYAIEGTFVPFVQSFARPELTTFFSLTYVYGYVFLLVFPFVAYFALDDMRWFRTTALAFALNYAIGLLCYLLFVSYGPRNLLPDLVDGLLFTHWPSSKLLTSQVNTNTNVFPSLHTSLSVTVALLAYRTRRPYPRWVPLAVVLAASVGVSTMYLGIHWATDVLAGTILGVVSVGLAERLVARGTVQHYWTVASERARGTLQARRDGD